MSYLGLDIGTGGCKAVVFDEHGEELASSFQEYAVIHPQPDWAELDPDEVIDKCFNVIVAVNAMISDPVVAMSISSQGEAFTPVDKKGRCLGNAMVASDARARDIVISWSKNFGTEKIYHITGHTPHPLFTLYKILWLKENQPNVWKNTKYFLCFEDLFHCRMGLEPKISWSMAGRTMMFDVTRHHWSKEILEAAGLTAEKMAVPAVPGEITGTIGLETGNQVGFKNPVVVTTTKGEITKALLEGVALEMKLNLQLMEKSGMTIDTFVTTGGGTRHHAWTQLKIKKSSCTT